MQKSLTSLGSKGAKTSVRQRRMAVGQTLLAGVFSAWVFAFYAQAQDTSALELKLEAGWNLVRLPLRRPLLLPVDGAGRPLLTFQVGASGASTEIMVPDLGYWVYAPEPQAWPIPEAALAPGSTDLDAKTSEWHLVSGGWSPAGSTLGAARFLEWDPNTRAYRRVDAPSQRGVGYWAHADVDGPKSMMLPDGRDVRASTTEDAIGAVQRGRSENGGSIVEGQATALQDTQRDVTPPVLVVDVLASNHPFHSTEVRGEVYDEDLEGVYVNGLRVRGVGTLFSFPLFFAPGRHEVEVVALDRAGHRRTVKREIVVPSAVDQEEEGSSRTEARPERPVLALHSPPGPVYFSVGSTVAVSGVVSSQNLAMVTVNGVVVSTSTGAFSTEVRLFSAAGRIVVQAHDRAGQVTESVRQISVDASPPSLLLFHPAEATVYTRAPVVQGVVEDAHLKSTEVTVGNAPPVALVVEKGRFEAPLTLSDGENRVVFRAVDQVGLETERTLRLTLHRGLLVAGRPKAPAGLRGLLEGGRTHLRWGPSLSFEDGSWVPEGIHPQYKVYRRDGDRGPFRPVGATQQIEWVDEGASLGQTVHYYVTASVWDDAGDEAVSIRSSVLHLDAERVADGAAPAALSPSRSGLSGEGPLRASWATHPSAVALDGALLGEGVLAEAPWGTAPLVAGEAVPTAAPAGALALVSQEDAPGVDGWSGLGLAGSAPPRHSEDPYTRAQALRDRQLRVQEDDELGGHFAYQVEYLPDVRVHATDTKYLADAERTWVYTQGIALAQRARSGTLEDRVWAEKLAQGLCRDAVWGTGEDGQGPVIKGWHFSRNTKDDDWKDARLVVGAGAWAIHGLGVFLASANRTRLPGAARHPWLKQCYLASLRGLAEHRQFLEPGVSLMTAGWTTVGLINAGSPQRLDSLMPAYPGDPEEKWAYYDVLDAIGYDTFPEDPQAWPEIRTYRWVQRQPGKPEQKQYGRVIKLEETDWRTLRHRVQSENVVTEHNLDVLSVLNHALQHEDHLGPDEDGLRSEWASALRAWRDALQRGVFERLWDDKRWKGDLDPSQAARLDEPLGRIVTGGVLERTSDSSSGLLFHPSKHVAIDNCSWLSLSVDHGALSPVNQEKLAKCLRYTIAVFAKELRFQDKLYYGTHYFKNSFRDPYIEQSERQETSYHLEATAGLVLGLWVFADAHPEHGFSPLFREEAEKLWAGMNVFVHEWGFMYSSERIQDLSTQLSSSTALIWYIDVHEYLAARDDDWDRPLRNYADARIVQGTDRSLEDFVLALGVDFEERHLPQGFASASEASGASPGASISAAADPVIGGRVVSFYEENRPVTLVEDQALSIFVGASWAVSEGPSFQDRVLALAALADVSSQEEDSKPRFSVAADTVTGAPVFDRYDVGAEMLVVYALSWAVNRALGEGDGVLDEAARLSTKELVFDTLLSATRGLFSSEGDTEGLYLARDAGSAVHGGASYATLDDNVLAYFALEEALGTFQEEPKRREVLEALRAQVRGALWRWPWDGAEGRPRTHRLGEGASEPPHIDAWVPYALYAVFLFSEGEWDLGYQVLSLLTAMEATRADDEPRDGLVFSKGNPTGSELAHRWAESVGPAMARRAAAAEDPRQDSLALLSLKKANQAWAGRTKDGADTTAVLGVLLLNDPREFLGVGRGPLVLTPRTWGLSRYRVPDGAVSHLLTSLRGLYLSELRALLASPYAAWRFDAIFGRLVQIRFGDEAVRDGIPLGLWPVRFRETLGMWADRTLYELEHLCDGQGPLLLGGDPERTLMRALGISCGLLEDAVDRMVDARGAQPPIAWAKMRGSDVLFSWAKLVQKTHRFAPRRDGASASGAAWGAADTLLDHAPVSQPSLASLATIRHQVRHHAIEALSQDLLSRSPGRVLLRADEVDALHALNPASSEYWTLPALSFRMALENREAVAFSWKGRVAKAPDLPLAEGSRIESQKLRRLINRFSEGSLTDAAQDAGIPEARLHQGLKSGALAGVDLDSLVNRAWRLDPSTLAELGVSGLWAPEAGNETRSEVGPAGFLDDAHLSEVALVGTEAEVSFEDLAGAVFELGTLLRAPSRTEISEATLNAFALRLVVLRGRLLSKFGQRGVTALDDAIQLPPSMLLTAMVGVNAAVYLGASAEVDVGLETIFAGPSAPSEDHWERVGVVLAEELVVQPAGSFFRPEHDIRRDVPIHAGGLALDNPLSTPVVSFDDERIYFIEMAWWGLDTPLGKLGVLRPTEGGVWPVFALKTERPRSDILEEFIRNHKFFQEMAPHAADLPEPLGVAWLYLVELAIRGGFNREAAESYGARGLFGKGGEASGSGVSGKPHAPFFVKGGEPTGVGGATSAGEQTRAFHPAMAPLLPLSTGKVAYGGLPFESYVAGVKHAPGEVYGLVPPGRDPRASVTTFDPVLATKDPHFVQGQDPSLKAALVDGKAWVLTIETPPGSVDVVRAYGALGFVADEGFKNAVVLPYVLDAHVKGWHQVDDQGQPIAGTFARNPRYDEMVKAPEAKTVQTTVDKSGLSDQVLATRVAALHQLQEGTFEGQEGQKTKNWTLEGYDHARTSVPTVLVSARMTAPYGAEGLFNHRMKPGLSRDPQSKTFKPVAYIYATAFQDMVDLFMPVGLTMSDQVERLSVDAWTSEEGSVLPKTAEDDTTIQVSWIYYIENDGRALNLGLQKGEETGTYGFPEYVSPEQVIGAQEVRWDPERGESRMGPFIPNPKHKAGSAYAAADAPEPPGLWPKEVDSYPALEHGVTWDSPMLRDLKWADRLLDVDVAEFPSVKDQATYAAFLEHLQAEGRSVLPMLVPGAIHSQIDLVLPSMPHHPDNQKSFRRFVRNLFLTKFPSSEGWEEPVENIVDAWSSPTGASIVLHYEFTVSHPDGAVVKAVWDPAVLHPNRVREWRGNLVKLVDDGARADYVDDDLWVFTDGILVQDYEPVMDYLKRNRGQEIQRVYNGKVVKRGQPYPAGVAEVRTELIARSVPIAIYSADWGGTIFDLGDSFLNHGFFVDLRPLPSAPYKDNLIRTDGNGHHALLLFHGLGQKTAPMYFAPKDIRKRITEGPHSIDRWLQAHPEAKLGAPSDAEHDAQSSSNHKLSAPGVIAGQTDEAIAKNVYALSWNEKTAYDAAASEQEKDRVRQAQGRLVDAGYDAFRKGAGLQSAPLSYQGRVVRNTTSLPDPVLEDMPMRSFDQARWAKKLPAWSKKHLENGTQSHGSVVQAYRTTERVWVAPEPWLEDEHLKLIFGLVWTVKYEDGSRIDIEWRALDEDHDGKEELPAWWEVPQPKVTEGQGNHPPLTVPLTRLSGNRVAVTAKVGDETLKLMLDNGSPSSSLTAEALARLPGTHVTPTDFVSFVGGATESGYPLRDVVSIHNFELDGHPFQMLMDVVPMDPEDLKDGLDGILGADLLHQHIVSVDLDNLVLQLYSPEVVLEAFLKLDGFSEVPFRTVDGHMILAGGFRGQTETIQALLDLGANATVMNRQAAALKRPLFGSNAFGSRVATYEGLEFSGLVLADRTLVVVWDMPGFEEAWSNDKPAMVIGFDLLDGRRIIIDYPKSKLYIR